MAQVTELSVSALPGPVHTFLAKAEFTSGPHNPGNIIELSLMGTTGPIHTFLAKAETEVADKTDWIPVMRRRGIR